METRTIKPALPDAPPVELPPLPTKFPPLPDVKLPVIQEVCQQDTAVIMVDVTMRIVSCTCCLIVQMYHSTFWQPLNRHNL